MNSLLLTAIQKGRLWDFRGGIHPPEMKDQTSQIPLKRLPLAEYFILPVQQHIGIESDTLVKIGDRVLKGQPLTSGFDISGKDKALPIHAPTSGIIKDIGYYTTAHPSGLKEKCLYLIADGQDRWIERHPINDYRQCSRNDLIGKIHRSGIAGLGGAGYPTASKLNGGLKKVEALIINAAECEPYITADDRLMQEHAAEIVEGIEILRHILSPTLTIIGIEDNKSQAIEALRQATLDHADILIRVIPTKYPSGGARQLTKILTGREVPQGKHSSAIGVLMQNVSTVYAIKRAVIDDEPLIERVTTLTGEGLETKGNVWVPLGTTVEHLLNFSGCDMSRQHSVAIMGGPLMGFTLPHLAIPIVKISNCILVPSTQEVTFSQQEQNCIRCGQCSDVCPAGLLPQQLYWYSRGKEHDKARNYNLFDCIECGACAYVCPSHIPLVQYYRQEKAEIKQLDKNALLAQQAKKRFEAKQSRLEREKIARQERHKNAAVSIDSEQNEEIQSALARVIAQQQARTSPLNITSVEQHQLQDNSQIKAARQARKDLARQRQSEKLKYGVGIFDPKEELRNTEVKQRSHGEANNTKDGSISDKLEQDPRKAAVAEAIARAKARKAQVQQRPNDTTDGSISDKLEQDPRKAAVAEAIARAKARKAQVQQRPNDTTDGSISDKLEQDPRKAAVAEAIARAKARKMKLQQETNRSQ